MQYLILLLSLTISLLFGFILGKTNPVASNTSLIYGIIFVIFFTLLTIIFQKIIKENKKEIVEDRVLIFYYSTIFLVFLIAAAILYLLMHPNLLNTTPNIKITWLEKILISIWSAMLGSVSMDLRGVAWHWRKNDWKYGRWEMGYIVRPLNGFIIGVITYGILMAITQAEPHVLSLMVAAFILGYKETEFYDILKRVAGVVLKIDDETNKTNKYENLTRIKKPTTNP